MRWVDWWDSVHNTYTRTHMFMCVCIYAYVCDSITMRSVGTTTPQHWCMFVLDIFTCIHIYTTHIHSAHQSRTYDESLYIYKHIMCNAVRKVQIRWKGVESNMAILWTVCELLEEYLLKSALWLAKGTCVGVAHHFFRYWTLIASTYTFKRAPMVHSIGIYWPYPIVESVVHFVGTLVGICTCHTHTRATHTHAKTYMYVYNVYVLLRCGSSPWNLEYIMSLKTWQSRRIWATRFLWRMRADDEHLFIVSYTQLHDHWMFFIYAHFPWACLPHTFVVLVFLGVVMDVNTPHIASHHITVKGVGIADPDLYCSHIFFFSRFSQEFVIYTDMSRIRPCAMWHMNVWAHKGGGVKDVDVVNRECEFERVRFCKQLNMYAPTFCEARVYDVAQRKFLNIVCAWMPLTST